MQKCIKKLFAALMALAVAVSVITTGSLTSEAATSVPTVEYRVHVQKNGWQEFRKNGQLAGTTGEAKRLEGIEIKVEGNANLGIQYRTHIQGIGWEKNWRENGGMSGTSAQAKRLEAIQIKLTGADAGKYDVYYRVHAQTYGWLGWAKNGAPAGTSAQAKRLEAIEIQILPKGTLPSTGSMGCSFVGLGKVPTGEAAGVVTYSVHVQSYGDQAAVSDGAVAGTFGEAKRLEGIKISLNTAKLDIAGLTGGITYRTHVQTYGWRTWSSDGALNGTRAEAKRLEAIEIKLTGEVANYYDVYYRVHAQTYGWLGWAKNGQTSGTAGLAKRLEGIQICVVPKGTAAPGQDPAATTNPYVSQVVKGAAAAQEIAATSLSIATTKASINVGDTDTVKATFAPADVTNKRLVYTSSDESVATVDASGKITAVKAGKATITATTTDGSKKSATVEVTVVTPVAKILAAKTKITLAPGKTEKAQIEFVPADATNKGVTYETSDKKVATVAEDGTITAVARGVAQIIVTSKENAKAQTMIEVTVKDSVVTKVTVTDKAEATLTFKSVGDTLVSDLDEAVKNCKSELQILKDEDWTATCGGQTYTVKYNGEKLTYLKGGEVITDIAERVKGKEMTLTAPVNAGKADKVIKAAEAIQNKSAYADNKSVKATITLKKTNEYAIKDTVVDKTYTTANIDGKTYKVYFENGAMYVVGNVTNVPFFKNMVTDGVAKLEVVNK